MAQSFRLSNAKKPFEKRSTSRKIIVPAMFLNEVENHLLIVCRNVPRWP